MILSSREGLSFDSMSHMTRAPATTNSWVLRCLQKKISGTGFLTRTTRKEILFFRVILESLSRRFAEMMVLITDHMPHVNCLSPVHALDLQIKMGSEPNPLYLVLNSEAFHCMAKTLPLRHQRGNGTPWERDKRKLLRDKPYLPVNFKNKTIFCTDSFEPWERHIFFCTIVHFTSL